MKKKWMSILPVLALILNLSACGGGALNEQSANDAADLSGMTDDAEPVLNTASSGDRILRIGVFEPQTGDNSTGGKQEILGIRYANYIAPSVDIGGETYDVKLEIVDNRTIPENGPAAAEELVSRGVSVVLGSYGSGVSITGGTVFSEAGIPAVGITCTSPKVTSECDVYFRICFVDAFQGTVLAHYAKDLGIETAYTLAMSGSEYDQGLADNFTQAFETLGGTVISAGFPEGTTNFIPYISAAKDAGAGCILAPVSDIYARLIIEAADVLGFSGVLLGSDTWDSAVIPESVQGKDVDVKITTFYQETGTDFDEGIKEWINANPDMKTMNGGSDIVSATTAMGYDAYFTALTAAQTAASNDPAAILAALPRTVYTGVSGDIEFDANGDAVRDSAYIKAANPQTGAWDFVTRQSIG